MFLPIVVLFLLISSFTYADTIYVSSDGTIEKFDSNGNQSTFASLNNLPSGFAFDRNGNLYATTKAARQGTPGGIYKLDSSGNQSTFADMNNLSSGIAFDRNGNLYVSSRDGTIEKFDSSGNRSTFVSCSNQPYGLAFNGSNNLYAAITYNNTIEKFDTNGNGSIFASGVSAMDLAFDASGNLYATTGSETIVKFDSNGNSTLFASGWNNPWPIIPSLNGLAFDSSGYLYVVVDEGDGTIYKFDSSGNRSTFASGLMRPWGIAVWVPEPASIVLLTFGGLALLGQRRNQRNPKS
jgi:sugar lactone lactonase YvrE